jgi:ketosteroid isomerase-like protein
MNITNRTAISLFAACLFLATGCALRQPNQSSHANNQDAKEKARIEQTLNDVFAAAEAKDFVRLDAFHAYGPKFTKFTGSSAHRLDAAAAQKGEHDGLGAVQSLQMQAKDLQIDLFGNVAITTFILDYSFVRTGESFHRQERATIVFVREKGEWKITHEHLSPVQP